MVFALREEFFGQFTCEFGSLMPAFIKEADLFNLEPLSRTEARDAILKPLEKINIKIGYDPEFVDAVLLPGLIGESMGGLTIDPPHLQIVCNQLYEQAKTRYAAKLERGGVVEIDQKLYDELQGTTGILHSYLDDRLAKIVAQMPDGNVAVLRSMLKTMIETTGTRKFVALPVLQRTLPDVSPVVISDGVRLLCEERIIETRSQDDTTSYSLFHEVMAPKVQSWYSEHEMERKKAEETLEHGLVEWKSSNKVVLLTEKQIERIRKWLGGEGLSAEAEQLLTQSQQAYEERQRKEAEQERRIRRNRNAFQMALAIGLVIALILSAIAFWQRNVAEQQKTEAQTQKQEAEKQTALAQEKTLQVEQEKTRAEEQKNTALKTQSLFFADLARQQNERQNYGDAILLALEALPKNMKQPDRPYVLEAETQLYHAATYLRERHVLKGELAAFSPEGNRIVTVDRNTVRVWNAATGNIDWT